MTILKTLRSFIAITACGLLCLYVTGCGGGDNDAAASTNKFEATISVSNNADLVHIEYVVTNKSAETISASDEGWGTWIRSYEFFDSNGERVWPPFMGDLSSPTIYEIPPGGHLTLEFDWDGSCYGNCNNATRVTPGVYTLKISDIFGNTTVHSKIEIKPIGNG